MSEVRAALQDLCDAWDHCPSKGHEGGKFKGNVTTAQAVAKRVLEKTAALPPLRAREEIARAGIKEFVERQLKKLDAMEGEGASRIWCAGYRQALESVERVSGALSSTAGQEWRGPEGWQLVPKEPMPDMLAAAFKQANDDLLSEHGNEHCKSDEERSAHAIKPLYRAMLSAAPIYRTAGQEWRDEEIRAETFDFAAKIAFERDDDRTGEALKELAAEIRRRAGPPAAEPIVAEKSQP